MAMQETPMSASPLVYTCHCCGLTLTRALCEECGAQIFGDALPSAPSPHDDHCEAEQPALPVTGYTACGCKDRASAPSPHEAIERELRIEWWQHHGCPFAALYGDDGEMQCSSGRHPSLDFKRMSLDELREHVQAIRMARDNEAWDRAAASAPSPQPSADTSPIMDRGHVGSGASPEAPPSTPSVTRADGRVPDFTRMPCPTDEMLHDPVFEAIWQRIKSWDICVPECYAGYCGAMGNHVRAILDVVRPFLSSRPSAEAERPVDAARVQAATPIDSATTGERVTQDVLPWLKQAILDWEHDTYRPASHYLKLFRGAVAEIERLRQQPPAPEPGGPR